MNPHPPNTVDWFDWEMSQAQSYSQFAKLKLERERLKAEKMTEAVQENTRGFTFGCDPELVVINAEGKPVPADMIPGTKLEPHPVEGGAVQRDGFAAEFNTDPASTFREFNANIEKVLKALKGFLPEGYTLEARPSVVFDEDVFNAADDEAKALGCTPDFNAWTGEVNPPPIDEENPFLRTFSGHLHIGWIPGADQDTTDPQHMLNCRDLAKQADWWLGGWSVSKDTDPARRRLYGRAGAIRYKPYGVEYRVLSNFWVLSRDKRLAVWNRLMFAINDMQERFVPDRLPKEWSDRLIAGINATKLDPELLSTFRYPLVSTDRRMSQY
jgi:hypothetical protein